MADVDFRVVHLDHSNNAISIHSPVDDSLRWGYRATDTGDISYDLSLTDDEELINAGQDSFAAYKTDWRLGMSVNGAAFTSIHAGIHTSVGLKGRSDSVSVSGRDWSEWLNQAVWFDLYDIEFNPDNFSSFKRAFNKGYNEDGTTTNDLGSTTFDANGFLQGPAYYVWIGLLGANFETMLTDLITISKQGTDFVNLQPQFEGFSFLETLPSYQIFWQDEGTYLDHLKTIASSGEPWGFDFYTDWDKKIYFFGPRKSVGTSPDPIWTLTTENVVIDSVPDFTWLNNGPLGTHIYALGQGSPAIWHLKHDQDSEDIYRKWLRLPRVGDIYQQSVSDVLYGAEGLQYIFPHKDLQLSIYPNKVNPGDIGDGFRNHVGDVVRFKWPVMPYHEINAYFWITQQDYHGDSANNWTCDLGLEQIYDTA